MRHRSAFVAFPLALSACVAPKTVHVPPPPVPVPVAAPHPPATTDWRDIPLTPGDWRYTPSASGSAAIFGPAGMAAFVARCDRAAHIVSLARSGAGGPGATMAITTSAGNRALAASAVSGPPSALAATLPARDPFLDKMAFSRGRFVVAVTGTGRLVIPSWPELARVVEDCR